VSKNAHCPLEILGIAFGLVQLTTLRCVLENLGEKKLAIHSHFRQICFFGELQGRALLLAIFCSNFMNSNQLPKAEIKID